MTNYSAIIYKAYRIVASNFKLWPLVFLQFLSLPLAIWTLRGGSLGFVQEIILSFSLLAAFSLTTVWLWLLVKAYATQVAFKTDHKFIFAAATRVFALTGLGLALNLSLKLLDVHWTVFALLASLINATLATAMLGSVLLGLNLQRTLMLSLDFWQRKNFFLSSAVFVVLVGHGLSYYLAHGFWLQAKQTESFAAFPASATIWILLVVLAVVTAFFGSLLNTVLVLLFLEISRPKKDSEVLRPTAVVQPATGPAAGI